MNSKSSARPPATAQHRRAPCARLGFGCRSRNTRWTSRLPELPVTMARTKAKSSVSMAITGRVVRACEQSESEHILNRTLEMSACAYDCAWSPDGAVIATSHISKNCVCLWNASDCSQLRTLRGFPCAWSPDSRHLVSVCDDLSETQKHSVAIVDLHFVCNCDSNHHK